MTTPHTTYPENGNKCYDGSCVECRGAQAGSAAGSGKAYSEPSRHCHGCHAHYSEKHECDGLMKMLVAEHEQHQKPTNTMDVEKYITEEMENFRVLFPIYRLYVTANSSSVLPMSVSEWVCAALKRALEHVEKHTLTRIAEEAREDERNHWLAGERCTTCGGEKEADPCTDTCLTCLEDE